MINLATWLVDVLLRTLKEESRIGEWSSFLLAVSPACPWSGSAMKLLKIGDQPTELA